MKNIAHRIFLFESLSSLSSIGFRIQEIDRGTGKVDFESELMIIHGKSISIHNNPDLPLNSFARKLLSLRKVLDDIDNALRKEQPYLTRTWLDTDTMEYTSTVSACIDKKRNGFVEIGSCAGVIRFYLNQDNWKEVAYGIDSVKQVVDSLHKTLRRECSEYFLNPNTLDIPALEKDFLFQLQNEYPHRDAIRCKKFFNDYLARHTKGEKDMEQELRIPLYQVLSNYLGPDW